MAAPVKSEDAAEVGKHNEACTRQTEVGIEKRIMCVGLVCVDIISSCTGYPEEDTDQSFVEANFQKYNICTDYCIFYDQVNSPLSVIIVNNVNGSRTILHSSKNLPEVSFKDFQKVDLSTNKYKWIHFEGRPSVAEIEKMITRVQMHNQTISNEEDRITISVELEKASKEMLPLAKTAADYVFMSKDLAKLLGFKTKEEAVEQFIHQCRPGAVVICAWGDTGAGAKSVEGPVMTSPAFSPDKMADTLGAGDTFNAATILALSKGCSVQQAITFGCQVAGEKCGMMGYEDLRGKFQVPQPLPKM